MKRIVFCLLCCLLLCACGQPKEESLPVQNDQFQFVSQEEYMRSAEVAKKTEVTKKEAASVQEALLKALGPVDTETGFAHVFLPQGKISLAGSDYYWGKWGWMDDSGTEEPMILQEFIISQNLSEAYSAMYDEDANRMIWYTNYNWLE